MDGWMGVNYKHFSKNFKQSKVRNIFGYTNHNFYFALALQLIFPGKFWEKNQWVDGWMDEGKSLFKNCLQKSDIEKF